MHTIRITISLQSTILAVFLDMKNTTDIEKIDAAMQRALAFSKAQYDAVAKYMESIGQQPIHIGETGWATVSNTPTGRRVRKPPTSTKKLFIII